MRIGRYLPLSWLSLSSALPLRASARAAARMASTSAPLKPLQIGLTGSIGMGKSALTTQLRYLGFPVFDADQAVHALYSRGGQAVEPIRALFPQAVESDEVNRAKLSSQVLNNADALLALEGIVHPLVAAQRRAFLDEASAKEEFMVVYDIPLLLENRDKHQVDYVLVVTASAAEQERRVLARPGMTKEKFEAILRKQVPDAEKRRLADFVVHTDMSEGFAATRSQLAKVIEQVIAMQPERFERWKTRRSTLPINPLYPFDVVAFDLDDTLVPTMPALKAAYEVKWAYMATNMPKTLPEARESLRDVMKSFADGSPEIAHDFRTVRMESLTILASKHNEQLYVEEAVETFETARSDLEPHLYDDSLPCLRHLAARGVRCCVMTNGSAMLSKCTALQQALEFSMNAADAGAMKPSLVPFISISLKTGVPPSRILYVGDSYANDVVGAQKAGMRAAFLRRSVSEGEIYSGLPPDIELFSLLPAEMDEKVGALSRAHS